ncbi:DUF397 domain-containing protein [Streptomyces sp. NPDC026672]|uniref:DUF397 domain-containing protein n=1 Tax=unclassified Streptomyces TaxID=2593676 RepID=UPI0033FD6E3A
MARPNLYEVPAAVDTPARTWCGGNLGGDNETCVTTTALAGMDAYIVGDSKPEGFGRELRMTGAELDTFAVDWARSRGLALQPSAPSSHTTGRPSAMGRPVPEDV